MKVLTVLGTRPEIIRLSRVISRLERTPDIEHVLVHTGQNYDYELSEVFFDDLELRRPDHFLEVSRESFGKAYGDILSRSEEVLLEERPDAVLILGDTNSALAAVIARRLHIPVFHMEAGNRSFDPNVPEEVNRRIVDHVSDFNLVYTEHARRNLLAEGIPARRIYLTGSPMLEVIEHQQAKVDASTALDELGLAPGEYFLVSLHREENVDHPDRLNEILAALEDVATTWDLPVLMSLHPRTRARLEHLDTSPHLRFHPPFGFSDYLRLQRDSRCVISDSGTIAEEAMMIGFAAVSPRDSIERPEALDHGGIVLCGLKSEDLRAAVRSVEGTAPTEVPADYQVRNTSERVTRLMVGLTGRAAFWSGLH